MASIYSTQFYEGYTAALGSHALYTVPAGKIAIIRSISVAVVSAAVNQGYIGVTGKSLIAAWTNLPIITDKQVNCRQVLNAGEVLTLQLNTSDVAVAVSGYLLD